MRHISLQSATANLLRNAAKVYHKMRQLFYYKMRQLLQNTAILLQNSKFVTKRVITHYLC